MENGNPPCRRCQRRRVTCTLRRQTLGDGKEDLSAALIHDLRNIHAALNEMRSAQSKPLLPPLMSTSEGPQETDLGTPESPNRADSGMELDMLVEEDPQSSTVNADIDRTPIDSLYQITRLKSLRSHQIAPQSIENGSQKPSPRDIISRGLLEHADADRLVQNYLSKSDHYLYDIASKYKDLESLRQASPLLLVAICATSALQDASSDRLYRICQAELRKLILDFLFTPVLDLEDLRGLVIASFWLSDVSWTVSGLVIRRALEVELQNSFGAVITANSRSHAASNSENSANGQDIETATERMKLWYLLYICDQHLSILYARTPMLGNQESIRNYETYLASMPDSLCNQRVMSQVSLLRILSTASDLFGVGSNERIPTIFKPQLDTFNNQIDTWASTWLSCYSHHPVVGEYPAKAVSLHYYFAKLLICSYVFRGLTHDANVDPIPAGFRQIAQMAVQCAMSIIDLTIGDPDLATALVGLPHYFHSMVAYACAFLIKTATVYRGHVDIDMDLTQDKIKQVIQLCNSIECGQHHLVRWIGKGLQILLVNCLEPTQATQTPGATGSSQQIGSTDGRFLAGNGTPYPDPKRILDPLSDPELVWDAARQATFIDPSKRMYSQMGDPNIPFSHLDRQYESLDYGVVDLNHNTNSLTGPEAHMEHFGLGLGLLR
ncbi:hypothetical protein BGZ63DRAFT_428218 [Mariannaea sp. PMI_226]|nr:hypothetical protein BGZ63DRAFT_428218 [Mariannaea sp. PMI_226]